jgi:Uma2 family endonuclease
VFYYPDVIVSCRDEDKGFNYHKKSPQIITGVLSDSTESFDHEVALCDRGNKFEDYRSIESLEKYVLISQSKKG